MRKLVLVSLLAILATAPMTYALTFTPGFIFKDTDNKGSIVFSQTFTTSQLYWGLITVNFNDFQLGIKGFGILGLSTSDNTVINVTKCDPDSTILTMTTPVNNTLTGTIYAPSRGSPNNVTGAATWAWSGSSKTLTFTSTSNSTLTVYWAAGASGFMPSFLQVMILLFIILVIALGRNRHA